MQNIVGRVFHLASSVTEFYKDLNPATLSGAIDVVVVEKPDGSLTCSPFHVRFGKLSLLRPQEKVVQMRVNDRTVDFSMKVGEAGEAFFVVELVGTGAGLATLDRDGDPLPTSPPSQPTALLPPQLIPGDAVELPAPVPVSSTMGTCHASTMIRTGNGHVLESAEAVDVSFASPRLMPDSPGLAEIMVLSPSPSDSVLAPPESMRFASAELHRHQPLQQLQHLQTQPSMQLQPQSQSQLHHPPPADVLNRPLSDTEFEMTSSAKFLSPHHGPVTPLSDTETDLQYQKSTSHDDDWNWGWGTLPMRKETVSPLAQLPSSLDKNQHASIPVNAAPLPTPSHSTAESPSSQSLPAHATSTLTTAPDKEVPVVDVAPLPLVKSMAEMGVVELSLCGNELTNKTRIVFEDMHSFSANLLTDSRLVVRYSKNYYSFKKFLPVLVCLAAFRKPLPDKVNLPDDSKSSTLGSWRQWWSRSATAAPTTSEKSPERAGLGSTPSPKRVIEKSPYLVSEARDASSSHQSPYGKRYVKTLRLTSEQLKRLKLNYGPNTVSFTVVSKLQGTATCTARIFLWKHDIQIVVSDIDGTITKSDALGHLFSVIGKDWTHPGIANLFTKIKQNGYELLYLTSRPIGQADSTRYYLKGIEQGSYVLPDGPTLLSPDRLMAALKREVIDRRPEDFKIACLKDIRSLFGDRNPFYAGFGNRVTDAVSYRSVDIPSYRIYSINSNGEVSMDFFAGYTSSYVKLSDLVDQIFPPRRMRITPQTSSTSLTQPSTMSAPSHRLEPNSDFFPVPSLPALEEESAEDEYNDYNFWRDTPGLIDIKTGQTLGLASTFSRGLLHTLRPGSAPSDPLRARTLSSLDAHKQAAGRRRFLASQSWDPARFQKEGMPDSKLLMRSRKNSSPYRRRELSPSSIATTSEDPTQSQEGEDGDYEDDENGDEMEEDGDDKGDWSGQEDMDTVEAYPYI